MTINYKDAPHGWRYDSKYILIDRTTIWGNPYKLSIFNRYDSLNEYEKYIRNSPNLLSKIDELDGKIMICHCHPKKCHGHILENIFRERFG